MTKWHIGKSFSPEEKALRSAITTKYGDYTLYFLTLSLLLFSFVCVFFPRFHSLHSVLKARKSLSRKKSATHHKPLIAYPDSTPSPTNCTVITEGQHLHRTPVEINPNTQTNSIKSSLDAKPQNYSPTSISSTSSTNSILPIAAPIPTIVNPSNSNSETTPLLKKCNSSASLKLPLYYSCYDENETALSRPCNKFKLKSLVSPRLRSSLNSFKRRMQKLLSAASKYIYVYSPSLPSQQVKLPLIPILLVWALAFTFLIFRETQYEFTYLAKRLGRVPVAMLPVTYFLTLRPSPLPQVFYLQLVPFHKWLSRIVFILIVGHAAVYLYLYISMGKLFKLLHYSNLSGIVAFGLFILLIITSLKPIRRRYYNNLFFPTHFVTTWIVLPLIYYHSPKATAPYVYLCLFVLLFQAVYRYYLSKSNLQLPVQSISSTMLYISLPKSQLPKSLQGYYPPGSHLRISSTPIFPTWFLPTWIRSRLKSAKPNSGFLSSLVQSTHPYTISSLPQDPTVTLCIRKTRFPIRLRRNYTITGPYASIPSPFFEDLRNGKVKRALFIAGGTGIAFCAPLMRHLRSMNVQVKLLWAIRDMNDAKVLVNLGLAQAALEDRQIEIYITKGSQHGPGSGLIGGMMDDDFENFNRLGMFQGMFAPQTDDERFMVTIDNTLCDGGEDRTIGPSKNKIPCIDGAGCVRSNSDGSDDYDNTQNKKQSENALSQVGYDDSYIERALSPALPSSYDSNQFLIPGFISPSETRPNSRNASQNNSRRGSYVNVAAANSSTSLHRSDSNGSSSNLTVSNYYTPHHNHSTSLQSVLFTKARQNYKLDLDFTSIMINSRPVLNLRIKTWLYGVAVDGNTCCCVDQYANLDEEVKNDTSGRWILASGGETLVKETEKWASANKFSFFKDEFSL